MGIRSSILPILLVVAGVVVILVSLFYAPPSMVVFSSGNFSVERVVDSVEGGYSVVLLNLTFNDTLFIRGVSGRVYGVGSTALAGIVLSGVEDFVFTGFRSVVVPRGYVNGLVVYNSSNVVIEGIRVIGSNIVVASSSNVTVDGCFVYGSSFPVVVVKNSSNVRITRCVFNDSYAGFLVVNSQNITVYSSNISVGRYLVKAYNSSVTIYKCNILGSDRVEGVRSSISLCVNGVGNYYASGRPRNCSSSKAFNIVLPGFTSPLESRKFIVLAKNIGLVVGVSLLAISLVLYMFSKRTRYK